MSFGNAQVVGLGRIQDVGMFAIRHEAGTAAVVRYCDLGIEIVIGSPSDGCVGGVRPVQRETIKFVDAPELRTLWGVNGWNTREIEALLENGNGPAH